MACLGWHRRGNEGEAKEVLARLSSGMQHAEDLNGWWKLNGIAEDYPRVLQWTVVD